MVVSAWLAGLLHALNNNCCLLSDTYLYIFVNFSEGVTADVKGRMSTFEKNNITYLRVDSLLLDLNVKKPRLSVAKIFNNNKILSKFLLFFYELQSLIFLIFFLQLTLRISFWKRTDMKLSKQCSRNCRKNSAQNSLALQIPFWRMYQGISSF